LGFEAEGVQSGVSVQQMKSTHVEVQQIVPIEDQAAGVPLIEYGYIGDDVACSQMRPDASLLTF
jgi:hypothetical protein